MGKEAIDVGLIDEVGGLGSAIKKLKDLINCAADKRRCNAAIHLYLWKLC